MVYKHTQVCPNAAPAPSYGAVFGRKPYKSTIIQCLTGNQIYVTITLTIERGLKYVV